MNLVLIGYRGTGKTAIGRLLAHCEQDCGYWEPGTGCTQHKRAEWIRLLIAPGAECRPIPPAF